MRSKLKFIFYEQRHREAVWTEEYDVKADAKSYECTSLAKMRTTPFSACHKNDEKIQINSPHLSQMISIYPTLLHEVTPNECVIIL